MEKEVLVYVDLQDKPYLVGRLWARLRKERESASFEYNNGWLAHRERFSLEPALKLVPGPYHAAADKPMFGAIGDSAPDRWERVLMRRAERRRAERESRAPRTLREVDYLLLVNDSRNEVRAYGGRSRPNGFSVRARRFRNREGDEEMRNQEAPLGS